MRKKAFLCKIGFHRPFSDGAMFRSALRCNNCYEWLDKHEGVMVDYERELWSREENPGYMQVLHELMEYERKLLGIK